MEWSEAPRDDAAEGLAEAGGDSRKVSWSRQEVATVVN